MSSSIVVVIVVIIRAIHVAFDASARDADDDASGRSRCGSIADVDAVR